MRIALIGNSGSGKSTLARWLAQRSGAPILDLDTVAWEPDQIAVARPVASAEADVRAFCASHRSWVVEGCYTNLVRISLAFSPRLLFLNPGEAQCLANCRARPWEPHKYASRAEQDERLDFLLAWVSDYYRRAGDLSRSAHTALFADYAGPKHELTSTPSLDSLPTDLIGFMRDRPDSGSS